MSLDKFLQKFVAKDNRFYPLFISLSDHIVAAASILKEEVAETDEEKRIGLAKKVKEHETSGDKITATLVNELYNAVITPFDREDVHLFGSNLDTFLDLLDDSAKKIAMYQPQGCDDKLIQISEAIFKDAEYTAEITANIPKLRDRVELLNDLCNKIKEIEHSVDDMYEEFMADIFKNEKNPIELIKKKNIVQILEDTTDHAKHISDTVRSIIVKNS